jgi:acyl-CoA reductase-like NAD-dependent aldehyde dehydrogenase
MCTSPQAVLIPRDGIQTADGVLSFTDLVACLTDAIKKLLADPERAAGVLGAIPNQETIKRLEGADNLGEVVLESETYPIPGYEGAVYRTPLVLKVEGNDTVWQQEYFGPISFAVAIDNIQHGLDLIAHTIETKGAITFGVYSTSEDVLDRAEQVAIEQGVALSCNLDGAVFVNQSAAFSDFHATGNNPAANASLTDPAFVAERFAVVQSRRHIK